MSEQISPCLRGISILVVDDLPENRFIAEAFLQKEGAQTETAEDGAEAVLKARDHHYDLILMDIQMPVLDGCDATQMIRQAGFSNPILAVTAIHDAHVRAIEEARIFDEIIQKPLRRAHFIQTILTYLKQGHVEPSSNLRGTNGNSGTMTTSL